MFSPKSPRSLSNYVAKSPHAAGEEILMVESGGGPERTCSGGSHRRHGGHELQVGLQGRGDSSEKVCCV